MLFFFFSIPSCFRLFPSSFLPPLFPSSLSVGMYMHVCACVIYDVFLLLVFFSYAFPLDLFPPQTNIFIFFSPLYGSPSPKKFFSFFFGFSPLLLLRSRKKERRRGGGGKKGERKKERRKKGERKRGRSTFD